MLNLMFDGPKVGNLIYKNIIVPLNTLFRPKSTKLRDTSATLITRPQLMLMLIQLITDEEKG